MAAVLRLKRKASDEPAEGLLIALKKSKCNLSENVNEVFFKFAATLNSENESVKDHIQAALSKEKVSKVMKWRDPKNIAASQNNVRNLCEKLKAEHKAANEKKKFDLLNNRRLIFAETVPVGEDADDLQGKDAEVRKLFHLYDIIEENEEIKKQGDEMESSITCNDEPLIREKIENYVYDVYIADRHIDETFVDTSISVRPCTLTANDIYSGDSDSSEECYDDEDDSNDENNWRNDYPDEETGSEKENDSESDDCNVEFCCDDILSSMSRFGIGDYEDADSGEDGDDDDPPFDYSRVLEELKKECEED